jgi:hypothetical protein
MLTESGAAPVGLLSVTVCAADVLPTGTFPKDKLEGLTVGSCTTVLPPPVLPTRSTELVPPGALLEMVSVPVVRPAAEAANVTSTKQNPGSLLPPFSAAASVAPQGFVLSVETENPGDAVMSPSVVA